jgi:hypothetical protein
MNVVTTIPAVTDEMVSDFSTSHLPWQLDVVRDAELKHRAAKLGGPWAVDCRLGGMSGRRGPRPWMRMQTFASFFDTSMPAQRG